ncbi:MAG: DUF721 domain-containing protein [Deltaproteobacteria bacterium]|nr:DUF721 domain-containing protein [Deltaproteobacteria bacterium]
MGGRDRKQRSRQAVSAASLIDETIKAHGITGPVREQRLVLNWREIVGDRVATRAWPDGLKGGVLHVRVVSSTWLQELSFLRAEMAAKVNQRCGDPPLVKEIRLHLGRRPDEDPDDVVAMLARRHARRRPRAPLRPQPSPEVLQQIEAETEVMADAELKEIVRDLRRRLGM